MTNSKSQNSGDEFSLFGADSSGGSSSPIKSDEESIPADTAEQSDDYDHFSLHPATAAKKNDSTSSGSEPVSVPKKRRSVKTHTNRKSNRYPVLLAAGGITAAVAAMVLIPYNNFRKSTALSLNTMDEIKVMEEKIEIARESGDTNIDKMYVELVGKQHLLDSLAKSSKHVEAKISECSSDTLDVFIREIMAECYAENYDIPPTLRERIAYYTEKFSKGGGRKGMALVIKRKETYFPYINKVFKDNHVPTVLRYVAMQESLLNPKAKSHVGAAGLWQFMPATGRSYGLVVKGNVDERYEWRKATHAAAKYFRTLLVLFGKGDGVLLAIASYNAGEGKIQRALKKVDDPLLNRNFGYLYRTSTLLAKESREYVPQILARAIIDKNREYYGF